MALGRLTRRDLDTDLSALLERIERLERYGPSTPAGPGDSDVSASAPPASSSDRLTGGPTSGHERARAAIAQIQAKQTDAEPTPAAPAQDTEPDASPTSDRAPRPTLGAMRAGNAPSTDPEAPEAESPNESSTGSAEAADSLPSREQVVLAWGDTILANLPNKVRVRFQAGRFLANDGGSVVFALDNQIHLDRCEEVRSDVDNALRQHFGRPVPMRLAIDDDSTAPPPELQSPRSLSTSSDHDEVEAIDPDELMDEETVAQEAISNLMAAFPDSELVTFDPPAASSQQGSRP